MWKERVFIYGLERKERRLREFTRNNSEVLGNSIHCQEKRQA